MTRQGLTESVARERLASEGHNELPRSAARSFAATVVHALAEPMFVLLLLASAVYLLLGDRVEAVFLLASVLVILAITIVQERRTARVLEALRDLSSPRALVVRDGAERRIPGREVVRGDLLIVREGDRVAADARVLSAADLRVDESLLTGESVPVVKVPATDTPAAPDKDAAHRVYASTLVVKGHGLCEVTATGGASEMGRIGGSMLSLGTEATPLQLETRRLVRAFAVVAALLCLALAGVYGATRGDWLGALLAGLTLAMAILPEEFPVVLTVFVALGAWRLARVNVLTRRVVAIEALGSATVLCVDKTGTLTQNRMAVHELWVAGESVQPTAANAGTLPAAFAEAIRISVLASEPHPFDPMERAFHALDADAAADHALLQRYPLSPELLVVTHVWRARAAARAIVAVKGAPESIVALCGLPAAEAARVLAQASRMADAGLRVLGLARAEHDDGAALPQDPRGFAPRFVGLIGLADPLRDGVPDAMRECRAAGVRVIMITGDYPATARAIAREAGLAQDPRIVSGAELDTLDDAALAARLPEIDVFARVVPAQKLRIVSALKARGDVVAMTGDGVNDGPALKAAHIGIAMGGRGTDVAREAAAIVLLDDAFGSIVRAIRQGRRIFDNLRKAMSYLVAVHIPIAGMGLLPVLLGGPVVLFPAHVVFLEFIIDPACSVVFEAEREEPDIMRRPPRPARQPILGGLTLLLALLEGGVALAFAIGVYVHAVGTGRSEPEVRALAFTAVVIANLSLILFTRAGGRRVWRHIVARNRWLWLVGAGTVATYGLVLAWPAARAQFRFALPTLDDVPLLAGFTAGLWLTLLALNAGLSILARRRASIPRAAPA